MSILDVRSEVVYTENDYADDAMIWSNGNDVFIGRSGYPCTVARVRNGVLQSVLGCPRGHRHSKFGENVSGWNEYVVMCDSNYVFDNIKTGCLYIYNIITSELTRLPQHHTPSGRRGMGQSLAMTNGRILVGLPFSSRYFQQQVVEYVGVGNTFEEVTYSIPLPRGYMKVLNFGCVVACENNLSAIIGMLPTNDCIFIYNRVNGKNIEVQAIELPTDAKCCAMDMDNNYLYAATADDLVHVYKWSGGSYVKQNTLRLLCHQSYHIGKSINVTDGILLAVMTPHRPAGGYAVCKYNVHDIVGNGK